MANLGYALAQGLAGASRGVGILADQYTKQEAEQRAADRQLANHDRMLAATEMMRQRAKEWDQKQATGRAQEISTKAKGILGGGTSEPVIGYEGDSGDFGVAQGSIPNDVGSSDLEIARAEHRAAQELGYGAEAKDARAILEFERRSIADERRDNSIIDANALKEKIAASKDENEKKRLEILLNKVLSGGGSEKETQVTDENGILHILKGGKAVPVTGPDGKPLKTQKASQADEAANARTAAQIDKELSRLNAALPMTPRAENAKPGQQTKEQVQAEIAALTAKKRELQGVTISPASNPNRKPLSAFGK